MDQVDPTERVLALIRSKRAREALRRWLTDHTATLLPTGWSGKGYTTAQLLGALLGRYRDHPIVVVMKIIEKGDGGKEYAAHHRALQDSPVFAQKHLAALIGQRIVVPGGGSIILQGVAGGGLDTMSQLDDALPSWHAPREVCQHITNSLLTEWNTESDPNLEKVGTALAAQLGNRLTSAGTVAAWAGRHQGLLHDPVPWLNAGAYPQVNPFVLIGKDSWGERLEALVLRGKTHGDLHPGNLLVGAKGSPFCLVDLSRYTAEGWLSWDPTYLTLTAMAKVLPDLTPRGQEALKAWCLDPDEVMEVEGLPGHLRAMFIGVHQAGAEWARRHSNTAGWERQRHLCLVVIALILTGRKQLLSEDSRRWFFWLAAAVATRLADAIPDFPRAVDPLMLSNHLFADDPQHIADDSRNKIISLDERRPARQPPQPPARDTGPATVEAEYWTRLVAELRSVQFAAPDWATMAARTNSLRMLLVSAPEGGADNSEVTEYLDLLTTTLDAVVRPGATPAETRAASERAEMLRSWILDQLS
ncbi:hypothetical protein Prum_070280 [Phytohabitans rumicis]|uniref:Uncharacterized protein n=2 Tax=Phytohabitans rumicis TaxID=1076125 RepID=A0A6V8LH17_9ACTN|nr:hypothetical protein Prum_070280 [Phytohabitans rumicis]